MAALKQKVARARKMHTQLRREYGSRRAGAQVLKATVGTMTRELRWAPALARLRQGLECAILTHAKLCASPAFAGRPHSGRRGSRKIGNTSHVRHTDPTDPTLQHMLCAIGLVPAPSREESKSSARELHAAELDLRAAIEQDGLVQQNMSHLQATARTRRERRQLARWCLQLAVRRKDIPTTDQTQMPESPFDIADPAGMRLFRLAGHARWGHLLSDGALAGTGTSNWLAHRVLPQHRSWVESYGRALDTFKFYDLINPTISALRELKACLPLVLQATRSIFDRTGELPVPDDEKFRILLANLVVRMRGATRHSDEIDALIEGIPTVVIVVALFRLSGTEDVPWSHGCVVTTSDFVEPHDGDSPGLTQNLALPDLLHLATATECDRKFDEFKLNELDAHETFGRQADLGAMGTAGLRKIAGQRVVLHAVGLDARGRILADLYTDHNELWKRRSVADLMLQNGFGVFYPNLTRGSTRLRDARTARRAVSYATALIQGVGIHARKDSTWPLLPQAIRKLELDWDRSHLDFRTRWKHIKEDNKGKYPPTPCVWGCELTFETNHDQLSHRCQTVDGMLATLIFRPDLVDQKFLDALKVEAGRYVCEQGESE